MSNKNIQATFGKYLEKRRLAKGFRTQKSLAEAAELEGPAITNIEGGKRWPTANTVLALANALNVDPFQLYIDPDLESGSTSNTANVDPSVEMMSFSAKILDQLAKLSPEHRKVCLCLIFHDESYLKDLPDSISGVLQELLATDE